MIIPVKCFSCGKPVGQVYEKFCAEVKKGKDAEQVLNELGVERYCCRRMILSQVDLIEKIARYPR